MMDIQSITSSIGAYTASPSSANSSQSLQQSAQAQAPEQRESVLAKPEAEPPRPVTNTLGQKTGTLINVTA